MARQHGRLCNTWISHGHSDHARGFHGRVFGTAQTLKIYEMRLWGAPGKPPECCPIEFHQTWEFNGAQLTAYPARHILGAAQLLIEYPGERLVYTGEIKLQAPNLRTQHRNRPLRSSDHRVRFLSREEAGERILSFARECLEGGMIPAFIGYPLGRGQEIVHVLCRAGLPTAVHGSIARFTPIYEEAGFGFSGFRNILEAGGKNYRLAYVSGWAVLDNAHTRAGAKELLPYSDHAGFEELLTLVEQSGAREVDVVHAYTVLFAHILTQRGITARAPREASARAVNDDVREG